MTGDAEDMRARLRLALPDRWFADPAEPAAPAAANRETLPAGAPVLDGLLLGLGTAWAGLHALLGAVRRQSRRLTATGGFLDLSARDLFGGRLPRRSNEADGAYRDRIGRALRRDRGTRAALLDAAAEAGAGAVQVFEPAQPRDTGAYNGPGLAWGVAGGWGSLAMPLECLVTVRRGAATDAAVQAALADALPAGGAAWVRVTG